MPYSPGANEVLTLISLIRQLILTLTLDLSHFRESLALVPAGVSDVQKQVEFYRRHDVILKKVMKADRMMHQLDDDDDVDQEDIEMVEEMYEEMVELLGRMC